MIQRRFIGPVALCVAVAGILVPGAFFPAAMAERELLPRHVTPATAAAVHKGLEYLAKSQGPDGGWHITQGGEAYPVATTSLAAMALLANGNTPSRGPYAPQVKAAVEFLLGCTTSSGLITGPSEDSGRPMHGHGFALLFLSSVYGMITNDRSRDRAKEVIAHAIDLTSRAQSRFGGWTYVPGSGDEGSVTVSQVQALRAAHNAGFAVPPATIEEAVKYIDRCRTPEGGISYSLSSGGSPRLAISAAAVATLYNAGEYDSEVAEGCLAFVWNRFLLHKSWNTGEGHVFYTHLYQSQAFYLAGDKYWDDYFPIVEADLRRQQTGDGSWPGDGIGPVYGTGIALIILQLPYKFLPVYQR